jgi:hypothetical protein
MCQTPISLLPSDVIKENKCETEFSKQLKPEKPSFQDSAFVVNKDTSISPLVRFFERSNKKI